jgi:hypothetical protein
MHPRTRRIVLIAGVLLLLLGGYIAWQSRQPKMETPAIPAPTPEPTAPVAPPPPAPVKPVSPTTLPKPIIPKPAPPPPPATGLPPKPAPEPEPAGPVTTTVPKPPPITLHKELIPKNIEIIRSYYEQEIVGPETTFGFDINGSGFTSEFEKMIRVDPGGLDIQVKNLRMVTANQIHGEMVVGSAQTTDFIYPRVLIKNLPVFRAAAPFAVVRPGEVLIILFMSLAEDGRSGRFRAVTNLDETMAKQFRVTPSSPGLEISPLQFHLPFAVEGVLQIGAGVPQGEYGMTAYIGQREVWKRTNMIRIVRPNVGPTGFVQGISAADKFHRPGDTVQLYLHGSGLSAAYLTALNAKVNELDMGPANFQFISAAQMRFTFQVPANAPLRAYGVTVYDQKNTELFKKDDIFTLVPPNWIGGVQVSPPVKPGQQGLLRVLGRDMTTEFVQSLQLSVDEPGIELKHLRQMDPSTLGMDIYVSSNVAPGDYWIHLTHQGKPVKPPYGSIIKVEAP